MATTHTKTRTVTYPRMTLILGSIRLAYKRIMLYSDEQCDKWLNAFKEEELESVTFFAITNQDGTDKKLIEFRIGIDWDKHRELVKLNPDVTLMAIPEHEKGIPVTINEAVSTYLELFEQARIRFLDCKSEDWYRCSSKVRADKQEWARIRKKLGLKANSSPLPPYSDDINENSYDMPELEELHSRVKTFF